MNPEAGRPAPPPLPGRAPDTRQRILHAVLIASLVVLVLVSVVFGLALWKFGFARSAQSSSTPGFRGNAAIITATGSPVLHVQSQKFNILSGDSLVILGGDGFQSRNGHLAINDTESLRPSDALTVSAWFNAPNYQKPMTIAGRAQNGPPWRYPFLSWLVRINTESLLEIDVGHAQNYTPSGWNIPPLQPNQWHFVTMTYDGRVKKLYLNGALITSLASGSPNSPSSIHYVPGRAILIGADESEAPVGDQFQGMIDDLRIYDRALSADEVQGVFQEGARRLPMRR